MENFDVLREISKQLGSDPAFGSAYAEISNERKNRALSQIPKLIKLSEEKTIVHAKLQRMRFWLFRLSLLLSITSLVGCIFPKETWFFSPFASIIGFSLLVVILQEIIKGAGEEIQMEYVVEGECGRSYTHVPSFDNLDKLMGNIGAGLASIIIGFAHLFSGLSYLDPTSFSVSISGPTSLYFSIVTFATVGFGDIYPKSAGAKLLVSSEIVISLLLIALVLSTLVSWVSSVHQSKQRDYFESRNKAVRQAERVTKAAKIGVYADKTLLEEAQKRAQDKRNEPLS